jgi:type II secretory pathway component GspD/PulD (secretin)
MLKVPNVKDVLNVVKTTIEQLGATNINVMPSSSHIAYSATSGPQERIDKYLNSIIRNTASVNLQILVINVNLNSEKQEGLDWASLQATIGDLGMSSIDLSERVEGVVGAVTGSDVSGRISRGDVDIEGVFNILNRYGEATTSQDINMETVSGMTVKVESIQTQSYVTELTSSTTSDSVTNSGTETDETENGIKLEFSPLYDSESGLISMDVDLSLKTLLGFDEFPAGNGETLRLPNTQEQSFNNTLRMKAGETKVIGGITYDSKSDNRNRPIFLDNFEKGASQNLKVTNNSLFIVIRPTVVEYVPERLGGEK